MISEELLSKAKKGDPEAENEIFQYLFARFKCIVKRRVGIEECEDIAQEACMTVIEKYKNQTFTIGFEAWAHGVLKNKIGNYLQGPLQKRKKTTTDKEYRSVWISSPREAEQDLKRQLIQCLKKIIKKNPVYARVLNFVHQGYQTEEICKRIIVTPNNFYVILKRGRSMLQNCLKRGEI